MYLPSNKDSKVWQKNKHFRYGTDEMARKKSISAIDWILLNVQLEIMIRHVTMIKK